MSSADRSSQSVREAAIRKKISRIAKQYNISLESVNAEQLVAEAQKGKTKLDERRRTRRPLAKSGNTLQRFANAWSQFMKVYAGVNEVAKGIDNQYGALASGALMVLLQVGENKEAREKAIVSIFEELTESWIGNAGRLKLYSDAYPDSTRLEGFVTSVYLGVAELAIESVEYYAMPPHARFWQAIRRPPKLGIDIKANEIKKAIHEVDSESIALLIQDYARDRKDRQRDRDQKRNDQSDHIARLLGSSLELADADKMIDRCQSLHAHAFAKPIRRKGPKHFQQISTRLLQDFQLYWPSLDSTKSSVLVLSGSNFDLYDTGKNLCWLSPVTTEIAKEYPKIPRSEGKCRLLFHSACSDQTSRFSGTREPIDVCVCRFIIQLLLSDDDFFSKHRQSIEDDFKDSSRGRSDTMKRLLAGCHPTEEVCIIIDRLDKIAPVPDDSDSDDDDYVSDVLESVLKIVSTASCAIRLVVTVDGSQWPGVRNDSDFESKWKLWDRDHRLQDFSRLCKLNWRQPELRS
ncbi:MAG: hypothetical protein LQ339_003920 [Xanthoria mediterranea]|nr:MAG: hypothetical protein LQ339_003920 [Xanthoria mediterranea]